MPDSRCLGRLVLQVLTLLALLPLLFVGCGGGGAERPILVIGLDGATWDILDPWIEAGDLPNLAAFRDQSAWGNLRTVVPYLSPPAWTSAVTGVNPGRHGIFDFQRRIPQGNIILTETARSRRATPIWGMLEGEGLRSAFINIPMTDPPDELDGIMVSGFPHVDGTGWSYPAEIEEQYPDYVLDQMEMRLPEGKEDSTLAHNFAVLEERWKVVRDLYQREEWDLFWAVFTATDRMQHEFWRFMDPLDPRSVEDEEVRYRNAVHDLWARVDEILGELLELAGPETSVLIMSDHGFGPIRRELRVDPYIRRQTLSATLADYAEEVRSLDPTDAARLYVHLQGRDPGGILDQEQHREVRDELKRVLEAARDPETGDIVVEKAWVKDEVYYGPYADKGPDVTVLPARGYFLVRGDSEQAAGDAVVGPLSISLSGWHAMDGIYLWRGPGFVPGRQDRHNGRHHNLMDVTPTLLYLLGVDVPEGLDGRVMTGVLEPDRLRGRPVTYQPPFEEVFEGGEIDTTGLRNLPYIGG
ncbi:MAG: hypothetical protein GF355_13430 [Candidatus Eisenbacteria bacterium]|nr:hypothetical protein [Candidatus Eisenbacteria bacterium]